MTGEFHKRIDRHGIFEEHTPDIIKIEHVRKMIDDAKNDILGEDYWFDWAKIEHDTDSQLVKDYKYLLLKLEKWFGRRKEAGEKLRHIHPNAVEVQINHDEPDEIELIIIDNRSHLATYFTLKEWENFKKVINSYDVETIKAAESEDIRISVIVDYQYGDDVTLHLDDTNIMTLIGFTITDWIKFKEQINEFKCEKEAIE